MKPEIDSSLNPYESGVRKVIPAVLVYGRFEDKILMIHRNKGGSSGAGALSRPSPVDFHQGKWNGLGGKLELDESPLDAASREFQEESGLSIPPEKYRSLGVLQFPNFKPHKQEDWIVFVFTVKLSAADLSPELASESKSLISDEGTLHWISIHKLLTLNLWPGDRHFIPFVLKNEPFVGTLWYDSLEVSRYWMQSLGLTTE
jgi:8-oxo-dGTP diphosphatase